MQLNTISLPVFTQLATVNFVKKTDSIPQFARSSGIFKEVPMEGNSGETREFYEIDLEEYASEKEQGDAANLARTQQGYAKELRLRRFALDQLITVEMRRFNKYPEVIARLTNLADTLINRLDLDLTHRLTFGEQSTYTDRDGKVVDITTGDGLPLFATNKTLRGSSVLYRNILPNNPALSSGSLEAMEAMRVDNTLNQFGEKMSVTADILWLGDDPNTKNTAYRLMRSTAEVSAPNSGVPNVYMAKYRVVCLPRLATTATGHVDSSKAKRWGLASSSDSTAYLGVEQEATLNSPAIGNNAEDASTENWLYTGRICYGIAIVSGRFISMSHGDGRP